MFYKITNKYLFFAYILLQCFISKAFTQRSYTTTSVLATNNWFKIGVVNDGVYKFDIAYFNSNNISTIGINSESFKMYGSNNGMISENNAFKPNDDLIEIPIEMNDGGDGIFNNADYFLLYAKGTTTWEKDSINKKFSHVKNLYSDTAYYFLQIGGTNGKRLSTQPIIPTFSTTVNSYLERYAYETDKISVLSSGKEWYGEEFSNIGANNTNRNFELNWSGIQTSIPITIVTSLMGRSIGTTSNFQVSVNNSLAQTHNFASTPGGYLDFFGFNSNQISTTTINQNQINLNFKFNGNANSQGFLNWFEVFGTRLLDMQLQNQLHFRDWNSVSPGSIAQFKISGTTTNTQVWDVTQPLSPIKIPVNNFAGQTTFVNTVNQLKEFISFNTTGYLIPSSINKISNQNLHQTNIVDGIIITHATLLSQAFRLANFHLQQYNFKDVVVTTNDIYNEFSGGKQDPSALRDFIKMYFDKAQGDTLKQPKYVVLFGAGSFDYKNRVSNNINLVPCYQSVNSINPLSSYTSDDFFGFLNDNDDVNNTTVPSLLDISVGRIPAKNIEEATQFVDKIINYHNKISFGEWRNEALFIADDKDFNLHLNDAEFMAQTSQMANPLINQTKLYLDAFPLESSSSGARYSIVNNNIVSKIFNGSLICNYSGHGGYQRLAEESIFTIEEINKLNNANKLSLFITATCDFAPYDDPTKISLGHELLFNQKLTGAIALLTTTRVVFAFSNKIINSNYLNIALQKNNFGNYYSLGESLKRTKNYIYSTFGDIENNRKFTLLGDPAIQLAFPKYQAQLLKINDQNLIGTDTLKPLTKYNFKGSIADEFGNLLPSFNGPLNVTIFDKPQQISTRGNTPQSLVTNFSSENTIIFKGKTTINNGQFNFDCIIPKDVNSVAGKGKMSLYANNEIKDASGINNNFYIGGINTNTISDNEGPVIQGFLNDETFVNGGLTNQTPLLIVKLIDSSGINASGLGIGHDLVLVIDGKENEAIVLNSYYNTLLNSYKQGEVRFVLPNMTSGQHQLKIKAWDVANNSSSFILDFVVQNSENLTINRVLNYPNPFRNSTSIWFEHNQPNELLTINVNIYTITGKLVKQIVKQINTTGTRVNDIFWDGKDEYSEKLGKGVYIYTIIAKSKNGIAQTTQKMYLL